MTARTHGCIALLSRGNLTGSVIVSGGTSCLTVIPKTKLEVVFHVRLATRKLFQRTYTQVRVRRNLQVHAGYTEEDAEH